MVFARSQKAKHREQAATYFAKGQYHEALIEYKNVAQVDPKDADVHYRLALTYLKLGNDKSSGRIAELAEPWSWTRRMRCAQLANCIYRQRTGESARTSRHHLVSAPQNTEGLILKGQSLINEKHAEIAG